MSKGISSQATRRATPEAGPVEVMSRPAGGQFKVPITTIQKVEADGVRLFYRAAGDATAPVVLLLHGFPTSSFMFRELIPRLAERLSGDRAGSAGFRIHRSSGETGNMSTLSTDWPRRSRLSRRRSKSSGMQSTCSTMARPPASAWRWLTRTESRRSFHRMAMPMKKVLATAWGRSGNTGLRPQQRIGRYSARTF